MTCKECIYDEMCFIKHTDSSHVCCEFKNRTDLVEVMRCKDCKHMKRQMGGSYCKIWQQYNSHGDDGYCNYGERR